MQSLIDWSTSASSHPLIAAAVDASLKRTVLLILAVVASSLLCRASARLKWQTPRGGASAAWRVLYSLMYSYQWATCWEMRVKSTSAEIGSYTRQNLPR